MNSTDASRHLRIFVVENHEDTLCALRAYLEQRGREVQMARTMADALDALPMAACDVLISDLSLDDGTGWELLQRMDLPQRVFAIAMSGFGMSADRARSKAAGFRHHLIKPIDPDALDVLLDEAAAELNRVSD